MLTYLKSRRLSMITALLGITVLSVALHLVSATTLHGVGGESGDEDEAAGASAVTSIGAAAAVPMEDLCGITPFGRYVYNDIIPPPGTSSTHVLDLQVMALYDVAKQLAKRELKHFQQQLEAGPKRLAHLKKSMAEHPEAILGDNPTERAHFASLKQGDPQAHATYVALLEADLRAMQTDLMAASQPVIDF
jgi:hypothetical protein